MLDELFYMQITCILLLLRDDCWDLRFVAKESLYLYCVQVFMEIKSFKWAISSEKGTYHICEQGFLRWACAFAPDPWLVTYKIQGTGGSFRQRVGDLTHWIAAYARLKEHKSDNFEVPFHMSHIMRKCFMSYANNKGADQPGHPHSLISAFVVCCLDSIIHIFAKSKISRS